MKKYLSLLIVFLLSLNVAFACMNDHSSIHFERQVFPEEDQLVYGSFYMHSKAFHEWRIKDRLAKITINPNDPALLDDLSVSYEKIGQVDKAINTLETVLNKYPNRYETLSNLGTFYIHNQQYEKGLELLKKAIKINPQAHYGREIYQIKVVEYISLNKLKPLIFPIQNDKDFSDFILNGVKKEDQKDELIRAIVGVSGMLKFGNSDSPILLEVLGDLYYRINKDYTPYQNNKGTLVGYIKEFYTAAYVRSGIDNKTKLEELMKIKNLTFTENHPLDSQIEMMNFAIKHSSEEKSINDNKEIEIIKNSSNPEDTIYKTLFATPTDQPDLFTAKKEKINIMLHSNYEYLINNIIEWILGIFVCVSFACGIVDVILTGIFYNLIYLKRKVINLCKKDKIAVYAIVYMLDILVVINLLFIIARLITNDNMIENISTLSIILLVFTVLLSIVCFPEVDDIEDKPKFNKFKQFLEKFNKISIRLIEASIVVFIAYAVNNMFLMIYTIPTYVAFIILRYLYKKRKNRLK